MGKYDNTECPELRRLLEKYDTSPLGAGKNWVTSVGGLPLQPDFIFVQSLTH